MAKNTPGANCTHERDLAVRDGALSLKTRDNMIKGAYKCQATGILAQYKHDICE